mgnify:CR=1 FL=1
MKVILQTRVPENFHQCWWVTERRVSRAQTQERGPPSALAEIIYIIRFHWCTEVWTKDAFTIVKNCFLPSPTIKLSLGLGRPEFSPTRFVNPFPEQSCIKEKLICEEPFEFESNYKLTEHIMFFLAARAALHLKMLVSWLVCVQQVSKSKMLYMCKKRIRSLYIMRYALHL